MIWFTYFLICTVQASQVKEMKLKSSDVGIINTALGYSTVLQLSQKPLNVVLGDQSSFRVEFINDSITLKPLRAGAKTNIFIFTDNDRFNLTVKAGPIALVDYVVRIRRVYVDPLQTTQLNQFIYEKGLKFKLIRTTDKGPDVFLDFIIENHRKDSVRLRTDQFRVVAEGLPQQIRSLYLDSPTIKSGSALSGTLLFPKKNLNQLSIWLSANEEKPLEFAFNKKSLHKKGVLHAL